MQADMRAFSFAGRPFDLVAIPYNSLQLLTSVDDQVACLANVAAVLRKPRGRLALEVSTFAAESPVGDEPLAAADGVELWGSLDVDGPLVRYRKRFRSGDQDVHEEEIVLRDYADGEFDEVLAAGGFAIESARSFRRGRLVNAAPIG
jgi:hypothetical protein